MPAKKKPVKNLKKSKEAKLLKGKMVHKLNEAPIMEQTKKTLEGENRSEMLSKAKTKVPITKPNCTAEVRCAKASSGKLKFIIKSLITLFPANHREVQKN